MGKNDKNSCIKKTKKCLTIQNKVWYTYIGQARKEEKHEKNGERISAFFYIIA